MFLCVPGDLRLLALGERIPMVEQIPRSLNLGNAVALVLYEALRQQGFPGMH